MVSMLGSLIAKIGLTLLGEKVVAHVLVYTAQHFAKSSKNELDDKVVKVIAEALSVKLD